MRARAFGGSGGWLQDLDGVVRKPDATLLEARFEPLLETGEGLHCGTLFGVRAHAHEVIRGSACKAEGDGFVCAV